MSSLTGVTVAVDLDGTVALGVAEAIHADLVAHGDADAAVPSEATTYDLAVAFGVTDSALRAAFDRVNRDGALWWGAEVDSAGVQALNALADAGARLVVVTARNKRWAEGATRSWVARSGLACSEVEFAADKTSVAWDVIVDDAPHNVAEALAAGRSAVLIDRSWNRDAPDLPRVLSWGELSVEWVADSAFRVAA